MSLRAGKRAAALTGAAAVLVVLCAAAVWWFNRTDDTPYALAAEPKAATTREPSDFLRPLATAAAGGPVTARAEPVRDNRSFLHRLKAPQGGTSEAELTLSDGKQVRVQLAREHGVWWGYALASAD
ncbi:hypothetical protein ABZ826_14990 [Streptomyces sp. NPDC047515]|uniref:hypothetical protein n=1 Tax=Streptomyces sp. NPDC047515 TaxID=3155380 RepID=UPI003411DEE7